MFHQSQGYNESSGPGSTTNWSIYALFPHFIRSTSIQKLYSLNTDLGLRCFNQRRFYRRIYETLKVVMMETKGAAMSVIN